MNMQQYFLLIIISVFVLILICCLLCQKQAFANVKTNINEVTRFLDDEIKDKDQLLDKIEMQKQLGANAIETSSASANIVAIESAEDEASSLNSIRAVDLDDAGRSKRISKEYSFYDEGEFEPDWTKPGNSMHKEDADDIVAATAIKIKELLSKLQEAGVICAQKKGPVQREPVYTIQLKKENQKNTEYDQFLCEEPRNKYSCTNLLHLTCIRKSSGDALPGTIRINVSEMPAHWWLGRGNDGNASYGYTTNLFLIFNTAVMEEVKAKIIEKIGPVDIEVPAQQIMIFGGEQVMYQLNEYGQYGTVQNTWHPNPEGVSGSIRFFYRAKLKAKCEEWEEDWTERCALQ